MKDCAGCKKLKSEWLEEDSFTWTCGAMRYKLIGYTELADHPSVPKWCPKKRRRKKAKKA